MTRDELLAALNSERYNTPHWFLTPPTDSEIDDSETTTARRRRALLAGADHFYAKEA